MLSAAQQGDEAAFARLWRDLNPPLVRYLTLGGEPAEDVAAETWATVVKGLRRFRGDEAAWRAWVFTTARRRAVDAGRRRARAERVELGALAWPVELLARDAADEALEHLDTAAALRLTAQLPALQAEVVILRVVAGLPVEHVARVVGRSPGAVRVATHRGLHRLALILERQGVTRSGAGALRE
ncbi:sigma-70 family RNA polymerase sigma factor [Nostocoides sp. HKS02]|nr:sigma-70 family RNA polymerase sigma factor [Tetrasphaera sp. HKS02]